MSFYPMSPKALMEISCFSVSLVQNYYREHFGLREYYQVRVNYSNGYGASIVREYDFRNKATDLWEIALLKDDCLDNEGGDPIIAQHIDEEEVVRICANICSY